MDYTLVGGEIRYVREQYGLCSYENSFSAVPGRDPTYGWVMVFAVFVLSAFPSVPAGSISVFLKPLSAEFGWSRGDTAFGYRGFFLFGTVWYVLGTNCRPLRQPYFGFIGAIAMTLSLFLSEIRTFISSMGCIFCLAHSATRS